MIDLRAIMEEAGWKYDKKSHGFTREAWVSWQQAEEAFAAAERGEEAAPSVGVSRVCAEVVQGASVNLDTSNDP